MRWRRFLRGEGIEGEVVEWMGWDGLGCLRCRCRRRCRHGGALVSFPLFLGRFHIYPLLPHIPPFLTTYSIYLPEILTISQPNPPPCTLPNHSYSTPFPHLRIPIPIPSVMYSEHVPSHDFCRSIRRSTIFLVTNSVRVDTIHLGFYSTPLLPPNSSMEQVQTHSAGSLRMRVRCTAACLLLRRVWAEYRISLDMG